MVDEPVNKGKGAKRRKAGAEEKAASRKISTDQALEKADECVEVVFGLNAGIVWDLLNLKGSMSARELSKAAGLRAEDVYGALGWLGRENKICVGKQGKTRIYSLRQ